MSLDALGWSPFFADAFAPFAGRGWVPARLCRETTINFGALTGDGGEYDAVVAGRVWHEAATDADLPAVGDWVALDPGASDDGAVIRARLPRRSAFSRKMPGRSTEEQIIGANVDHVVIVTDAGPDFNRRRIERYLALVRRGGAEPCVLINKHDLFPADEAIAEILAMEPEVRVHALSALDGGGVDALAPLLAPGVTLCVVGSSGVGKSTLVNRLLGEEWLDTGEVNQVTGKGRHTTTARELVPLPCGALLIDNPGMREIQMWTDEKSLRESFIDVEAMAARCRFRDCRHNGDAGCALGEAVAAGDLDPQRLSSFLNLESEIAGLRRRARKRDIALERRAKRGHRVKARNLNDRIQLERDERGQVG